jgi:transposase
MLQLTFVLSLTKGHCSTMNNVQQLMEDLKKIPQNKLSFNIIRRLFIIFLYSLGFPEKKIETLLCLSRGRANYWISNYKNNGIYFLLDKSRSGRPSFVNKEEVDILKTEIVQLNSEFNEEKVVHVQVINSIIESKMKLKKNLVKAVYTNSFKEL